MGDSEISSAAEPGGRFSTPVSTIDSEYTHTGVYVHHGAWTDDGANEETLLNGGAGVEELELLEQPRVLYSRASYNTGEERTRDQHTENTFKNTERNHAPSRMATTTNTCHLRTDKQTDQSEVVSSKLGVRAKVDVRRRGRGADVARDAVRSKDKLNPHKTTSRKPVSKQTGCTVSGEKWVKTTSGAPANNPYFSHVRWHKKMKLHYMKF